VRRRQVLHRPWRRKDLPPARRARGRAARQPQLRRPARGLARLAHHLQADARGLRALRPAGERRRQGHGLCRRRRTVARRLRHAAGADCGRDRPPVGPGQAAVRATALLHPHPPGSDLRGREGRSGRRHAARAPDGQHVAAGLEQPVGPAAAVQGRRRPGHHRRAAVAVPAGLHRDAGQPCRRARSRRSGGARARRAAQDRQGHDPPRRALPPPAGPAPAGLVESERDAQLKTAKDRTRRAEDFYTSLGMPKLPDSYWEKSQFIKPRDRDVVCHASAWDMNLGGSPAKEGQEAVGPDVRTKMCIKPNEEDFTTIYHELGHVYYYLAYNKLPPIFQGGANDGFHEAIGDTIVLSMTPKYLNSIGLVDAQEQSHEALINAQMRMALAKVAFLPFGLMIDRWRWGVFDG